MRTERTDEINGMEKFTANTNGISKKGQFPLFDCSGGLLDWIFVVSVRMKIVEIATHVG